MERDVWRTAFKHGINEPDIRHALANRVKTMVTVDDMVLIIGPGCDATTLEIGIGDSGAIVHAMKARPKYWP